MSSGAPSREIEMARHLTFEHYSGVLERASRVFAKVVEIHQICENASRAPHNTTNTRNTTQRA